MFYSGEDGGYIAHQANAHGISAFGETPELALAELRKVFRLIDEDTDDVPFSWDAPLPFEVR